MVTISKRVRLALRDPDAGYGSDPRLHEWPVVEGHIVSRIPALHGKLWYLIKLEKPLPAGFNPLQSEIPEMYETIPIWYLLLSPRPAIPTKDVPPDYIGECLVKRQGVLVGVSVVGDTKKLPRRISDDDVPSRFPGLCSGYLEAL